MKNTLIKALGIETHEADCERLQHENESLARQAAHYKVKSEKLEEELALYKLTDEEKVTLLRTDADEACETFKKRIAEYEDLIALAKKDIDIAEQKIHRAYANGRMDAYAEMGIRNIEAHERGNMLVRLPNGEIVEHIIGLEDVAEMKTTEGLPGMDEIVIDDLTEV